MGSLFRGLSTWHSRLAEFEKTSAMFRCFVLFCCIQTFVQREAGANMTTETYLMNKFFKNKIDARIRPAKNREPVVVWINYVLVSMINVNQRDQILSLNGRLVMKWLNKNITWSPFQHNVRYLVIKAEEIWHPDLFISNSADNMFGGLLDHENFRVQLHHSGLVVYITRGVTSTFCQLDLTYFPFDAQACYVSLSSLSYSEKKMKLTNLTTDVGVRRFHSVGQWMLTGTQVAKYEINVRCDKLSVLRFTFYLRRKPLYFVIGLIIPCTIASFLVIFVYLLPSDSTEKISLSITTLLAFSVFQLNVSDNTPKTSQYIPVMAIYILFVQLFAALSLITSIFILTLNHDHNIRPPSRLLQKVAFNIIGRLVKCSSEIPGKNSSVKYSCKIVEDSREIFKRKSIYLLNVRKTLIEEKKKELLSKFRKYSTCDDDAALRRPRVRNLWKKCVGLVLANLAELKTDKLMKLNSKIFARMLKESNEESEEERHIKLMWSNIVNIFDRFFFIIYVVIDIIACLIIFVIIPSFAPKSVEPATIIRGPSGNTSRFICH